MAKNRGIHCEWSVTTRGLMLNTIQTQTAIANRNRTDGKDF